MVKIPKYVQVRLALLEIIENTRSNERVPSERELAEMCDVSRMTARKAILELENEGLLFNKGKKGVFVSDKRLKEAMSVHAGFTQEILRQNAVPRTDVIDFKELEADETLAGKLGIDAGDLVYNVQRIRYKNDVPVIYDNSFFPADVVVGLTREIATDSVYKYIMEELNLKMAVAEERVRAKMPTTEFEKIVQNDSGKPVVTFEITGLLEDGRVFEYTRACKNPFEYELVFRTKYGY